MADGFESAWLKWGWAARHAHALEAEIERVGLDPNREPLVTLAAEYNAKRHGFALRVDDVRPLPPTWNLLLGDAVNNFRCALDHLAWALVQRGSAVPLTKKQAKGVYFPVAKSAHDFKTQAATKLPGVRRADLAIIRRYQPFARGETRVQWHFLPTLFRLSNDDKHRVIQGVWLVTHHGYKILESRDCVVTGVDIKSTQRLLKVGTEVGPIPARKTDRDAQPYLKVEYDVAMFPALDERLRLDEWLQITTFAVLRLLQEFAEIPREIVDLGLNRSRLTAARDVWRETGRQWASARGRKVPTVP